MTGVIISNKMDKCVTLRVDTTLRHSKYGKLFKKRKKYKAACTNSKSYTLGQVVDLVYIGKKAKTVFWKVKEN